ncbi:MAG: hypothetical protein E7192_00350 [Erysipelotrichaceae bacterium]|nr:hypothetical protein [Erysipelotrichaceae bacterium]
MAEKQNNSDKQPIIFKKKRGGISLTKGEIKHIKSERKKLRKQMKQRGLKKRQDFEVTAASLGLYFDKRKWGLLFWWLHGRAFWALLGALIALLFLLFLASLVTQMRGHFTINLSDDLMKAGFTLSETQDFAKPNVQLFSDPVEDVPCISLASIPEDVDQHEGNHSDTYFAYTFFMRNESDFAVDYVYDLSINNESKNLSSASWIMLFQNGIMRFFAEAKEDGSIEMIPASNVNDRGYPNPWMKEVVQDQNQFELVGSRGSTDYYRVHPIPFESEDIIVTGDRQNIDSYEIDKYTIVIWLEGDDPDCTDDLIEGHLGLEMNFQLIDEDSQNLKTDIWTTVSTLLDEIVDYLIFWDD